MKAFALNRVQRRNADGEQEVVPAKTVFDVTKANFAKLEALGAVRKATADEIAVAKDIAERSGLGSTEIDGDDDDSDTAPTGTGDTSPPPSGADGDPNGKPKGGKPKGSKPEGGKPEGELDV